MKLYAESTGSGPDLVLLHGWGMNSAVWSSVRKQLAAHFRITLIELPGHGGSEYEADASSLDDWANACLQAAPERSAWIGWSLGGHLALQAALVAPERIEKLVLVSGSPRFVEGADWPHAMSLNTLTQFAKTLAKNHKQTLARFFSLQVRGDEDARQTLRLLRQNIAGRSDHNDLALEHGLNLLLTVDLRDQLQQLNCPTLWLLGERDTLVPVEVAHALGSLMPEAEILTLSGSAHAPFLSHPKRCLEALIHFLEDADE
ncbi:pimeloyl-ACP methyl ester esterase BioH [Candidatus Vondammii sp. HM_W22]|uniref:pimeloyl-ACP methyl ester esterase BioH n=1 Tax=Candidatus Vondammii sp. HM_W22 TaxID=2687299 RepID=UPI001F13F512|nr:pimeloyl-ACP methyl ester esterase BioH [Candidatus Vondammii sp. HM_W22]